MQTETLPGAAVAGPHLTSSALRLKNLRYRARHYGIAGLKLVQSWFGRDYVLPDFLIIGAMKSGTSSLYRYLLQHPAILGAAVKEVGFLDRESYHRLGERWYGAYFPRPAVLQRLSAELGYRAVTGEASPAMLLHAYAINAARHVPNARLIAILRNPVDRAYSHYQHIRRSIVPEPLSFRDALAAEETRLARDVVLNSSDPPRAGRNLRRYSYALRGVYIDQLEYWLQYFPRHQLLVLCYEHFFDDPASTCNRIAAFLGLPEHPFVADGVRNPGHYTEPMDAHCREYLTAFYRPCNRRLFDFLGEDWGWPC